MYLTVHGAAALTIAQASPNLFIGFLLGLASHVVLDIIPHGDELPSYFVGPKKVRRLMGAGMIDGIILALFLILYVWTTPGLHLPTVLAAVIGAVLPDALQGMYFLFTKPPLWLEKLQNWHRYIHNPFHHHIGWKQGTLVQCLVFAALWLGMI